MYIYIYIFATSPALDQFIGAHGGPGIMYLGSPAAPMPALTLAAAHHARFTVVQSDAT